MSKHPLAAMSSRLVAFSIIVVVAGTSAPALADPRPFTFSNDTYPMGKGDWEFEQHVRYRAHKDDEPGYELYQFREEFEFGVADNFDLAVYLPSWRYEDSDAHNGMKFESVDIEGIFYFTNPVTDFVGIGLYGEVKIGDDSLGFENKLLVQKDVGNWVFLYNFVVETEIEGILSDTEDENEVTGELKHTFGASYNFPDTPFFVGAEAQIESEYADWSDYEGTTAYAGPNFSYQGNPFWITVTPTFQVTNRDSEAEFQLRMILGWQFN